MTKPAEKHTARDAYLNLVRVHEQLHGEFSGLFREHGLTHAQYNVLRILMGGGPEGLSCQQIGERLITRVPDVTRLVDRMEVAGLVRRHRSSEDRRVVIVLITAKGQKLCSSLDQPVMRLHRKQLAHLSDRKLAGLNQGLLAILQGP